VTCNCHCATILGVTSRVSAAAYLRPSGMFLVVGSYVFNDNAGEKKIGLLFQRWKSQRRILRGLLDLWSWDRHCPETATIKYQRSPSNIPKERKSQSNTSFHTSVPPYLHILHCIWQKRQCTYNVTLRRVRKLLSPWKSYNYYLLVCECVTDKRNNNGMIWEKLNDNIWVASDKYVRF
jgi:hypothetical protein